MNNFHLNISESTLMGSKVAVDSAGMEDGEIQVSIHLEYEGGGSKEMYCTWVKLIGRHRHVKVPDCL